MHAEIETIQNSHIDPIYTEKMDNSTVETDDSFSNLLELAANNDVEGFKQAIEHATSSINGVGLWYGRKKGSKQMMLERRTPLMVAATYGSIDVLKLILDRLEADVNLSCGPEQSTALHCAAASASLNAVDVVKLLLQAGADPNIVDANGHLPADVVVVPPKIPNMRVSVEALLKSNASNGFTDEQKLRVSTNGSDSSSPRLSSPNGSPSSPLDSVSSTVIKFNDLAASSVSEKKEFPVDPSLPDIKNSIYSTDEFRMFSFKVRPCSRAYSHDWTECPFVHPGENARRRDPRKYHYSCVPCPDFRKGACRRGDMCEYAHGVFECWLHPAQYRTRLCKDGTTCARRVCFFAHRHDELRPLYISTGSAVPSSPRSAAANAMDMAAAMSLFSGSPSANGMPHSSFAWPHPNVPTLNLPSCNFQTSRLRSSLNARDIPPEDFDMLMSDLDVQQQLLNDIASYSHNPCNSPSVSRCNSKMLAPSNLDELFLSEISSSPRYSDQSAVSVLSPSHKSALLNQFQQQQSMLSPIDTNVFSPGRMSPRSVEPISPMGARISGFGQREKQHQRQQLRSLSSRDLGSPTSSWSKLGSPIGKADWSVNDNDMGLMQRSSSYNFANNDEAEPDLSWVQSLVKESPPELQEKSRSFVPGAESTGAGFNSNSRIQSIDHSGLGDWFEHMQLNRP